jgi:hypothetical protein
MGGGDPKRKAVDSSGKFAPPNPPPPLSMCMFDFYRSKRRGGGVHCHATQIF